MTIKLKLRKDLKAAITTGDAKRKSVIRMLLSELTYAETATHSSKDLDESTSLHMITNYYKRLINSLDLEPDSKKNQDTIETISIVESYLPETHRHQSVTKLYQQAV